MNTSACRILLTTMPASRHEPRSLADIASSDEFMETKHYFEGIGWMPFLSKFDGYDLDVAIQFAKTFDGHQAVIKGMKLVITEELISQALELPNSGERWFKGTSLNLSECIYLFLSTCWSIRILVMDIEDNTLPLIGH